MQRTLKIAVVICSLVALGSMGCSKDKRTEQMEAVTAVPVAVAEVARGDISKVVSLTGDIEPWRQVNIVPDLPGKVAKIYVKEGDRVRQGQLLAELDTRTARLQLQQAEAGLAVAQANFHSASKDWKRMQDLHQKRTVSPQQYEKAQLAYEAARAQLQQAEAALKMTRHQLEVSVMKAPFAGVIAGKNINEGEYINPAMSGMGPGASSVVTLMDLSRVKIKVNVSEKDMASVRIGQKARITVDAYPEEVFIGEVSNVGPVADPMTRSFAVEITVANPQMKLRAGMFARVEIFTARREEVLLIPTDAVVAEKTGTCVFVLEGGKVRRRPVQLGLKQGLTVEVVNGLREGEKVVTVGKEMLQDGATVTVEGGEAR